MVNLNNFKVFMPLVALGIGKWFSNSKSADSAVTFHNAAIAQVEKAAELQSYPISNQTHWSPQIAELLKGGPSLFDGKVIVDFLTAGTVSVTANMAGMQSAISAAPAYVLVPATAAIAYSEYTRSSDVQKVIKGLYNPDCAPEALQSKLAAASKVGNGKSPEEYAQFIATLSNAQDLATIVELGVSSGVLLNAYNAYKAASLTATAVNGHSYSEFGSADGSAPASAPAPAPVPAPVPASGVLGAVSGYAGKAYESISSVAAHVRDSSGQFIGSAAGSTVAAVSAVRETAYVKSGITLTNVAFAVGGGTAALVGEHLMPIASNVKSTANSTANTLYNGAHYGATSAIALLNSDRANEIGLFIAGREANKLEIMSQFLKVQFDICAVQEGKSYVEFLDTYTVGDCGDNTLSNLLTGACKYDDPLASSEL